VSDPVAASTLPTLLNPIMAEKRIVVQGSFVFEVLKIGIGKSAETICPLG
jgi:hypothetical protein